MLQWQREGRRMRRRKGVRIILIVNASKVNSRSNLKRVWEDMHKHAKTGMNIARPVEGAK